MVFSKKRNKSHMWIVRLSWKYIRDKALQMGTITTGLCESRQSWFCGEKGEWEPGKGKRRGEWTQSCSQGPSVWLDQSPTSFARGRKTGTLSDPADQHDSSLHAGSVYAVQAGAQSTLLTQKFQFISIFPSADRKREKSGKNPGRCTPGGHMLL